MSKVNNLTRLEVKQSMSHFLEKVSKPVNVCSSAFVNYVYQVGFFSAGRGVYSGVSRIKSLEDADAQFRYYGFNINLINHDTYIQGISGNVLKNSSTLYQTVFGYGGAFKDSENTNLSEEDFRMFKNIGLSYGVITERESNNIGRGIARFIEDAPIAERVYKEFDGVILPFKIAKEWSKYAREEHLTGSFAKLSGMTKEVKQTFIENKVIRHRIASACTYYQGYELISNYRDSIKRLSMVERIRSIAEDVDKERGYELASVWVSGFDPLDYYARSFYSCLHVLENRWGQSEATALKNLVRYLYGSCYLQQGLSFNGACRVLIDYYDVSRAYLKVAKYPRYLRTAHDVVVFNQSFAKNEEDDRCIYRQYLKYNKLEGMNKDLCVMLAQTAQDITDEGNQQSNCVGSYVHKVAMGNSLILFFRDPKDYSSSHITLELAIREGDTLQLVQAFSTYNTQIDIEDQQKIYNWCIKFGISYLKDIGGCKTYKWDTFKTSPLRLNPIPQVGRRVDNEYLTTLSSEADSDTINVKFKSAV